MRVGAQSMREPCNLAFWAKIDRIACQTLTFSPKMAPQG